MVQAVPQAYQVLLLLNAEWLVATALPVEVLQAPCCWHTGAGRWTCAPPSTTPFNCLTHVTVCGIQHTRRLGGHELCAGL